MKAIIVLGISVYFKDYNPDYLEKAARAGAKYVFTSLQIPEEDYSDLDQKLPDFFARCKSLNLEVIPDISPATFSKLGIKKDDYGELKRRGFKSLRLDYGFNDFSLIKKLQQDFFILLNASVVTPDYLHQARQAGIDFNKVALTYNFYPHTDTGLSWEDFKHRNWLLKDEGLTTQAFVPGDVLKRFPLYEGLPTVEKQRTMNPYVAAVQLIHEANVDDVFVGDSEASIKSLKNIVAYQKKQVLHLECHLLPEYKDLYGQEIAVRADQPENLVRLLLPRKANVPVRHNTARRKGSIVMQNKLAGRYSGEVYLIKKDLSFEARSSVIGFLAPDYVPLLEQIDAADKVIFDPLEN